MVLEAGTKRLCLVGCFLWAASLVTGGVPEVMSVAFLVALKIPVKSNFRGKDFSWLTV